MKINFLPVTVLVACAVCFTSFSQKGIPGSAGINREPEDSLLFSFAVVGCNRVDKQDLSSSDPSTANLPQLNRTFRDILALKNKPKFFFFVGDMVIGYTGMDTTLLKNELSAWVALYEQSGLKQAGIELVPTPGNHEVLSAHGKPANASAEQIFTEVMQPYIKNNNGPLIGGLDSLQTDQSELTYSFDYKNTHFVMLNTDDVDKESRIPYHWVINDIKDAKQRGAEHIFALGHKPAYPYPGEDGLDVYPNERDSFWLALEAVHSEAMFAAHNHIYYRAQPDAYKTRQIVAGNGGSPLSAFAASPWQKNFGFVLVEVYQSGKVLMKEYARRDVPADGYLGDPTNYPTTVRDSVDISWGK
jgi:hypothetical protein